MIKPLKKSCSLYDSTPDNRQSEINELKSILPLHLSGPISRWAYDRPVSPQQNDEIACGVFACANALAVCLGRLPTECYTPQDIPSLRLYIAAVILEGGFRSELSLESTASGSSPSSLEPSAASTKAVRAGTLMKVCVAAVAEPQYRARAEELRRFCGNDIDKRITVPARYHDLLDKFSSTPRTDDPKDFNRWRDIYARESGVHLSDEVYSSIARQALKRTTCPALQRTDEVTMRQRPKVLKRLLRKQRTCKRRSSHSQMV